MKVPPLILHEDQNALLHIIKSIASKEEALATCANAEALRLHSLGRILEKTGYSILDPMHEHMVYEDALAFFQAAQAIQQNLSSMSEFLLHYCNITSLLELRPTHDCICSIKANGTGYISNQNDVFYSGSSSIKQVNINMKNGSVIDAKIIYEVERNDHTLSFEGITDELEVYLVGGSNTTSKKSVSTLIVGQGIAKYKSCANVAKGIVPFALTLWDTANRRQADKFRMVLYSQGVFKFIHDTGIVS